MITIMGERSNMPPMGGINRRSGASTGSVIRRSTPHTDDIGPPGCNGNHDSTITPSTARVKRLSAKHTNWAAALTRADDQ